MKWVLSNDSKELQGITERKIISGIQVPIKSWCETVEDSALKQMANICSFSFIYKWGVLSADAHSGYGFPIGGVAATENILFPYGVGSDIGCFTGDTKIALLDGTTKTFEEQLNKEFWIYSISDNNMIVPGFAKCIKTRENAELIEIKLDNDEKIRCTPDQLFKMRNGEYREAQNLKPEDNLMPFYRTYQRRDGYEILHNPDNHYTLTHKIISEFVFGKNDNLVTHHINKNKLDNRPENFEFMTNSDHNYLHGKDNSDRLRSDEFKKNRIKILRENGFYDPKFYYERRETAIKNITDYMENNPEKYKEDIKLNGQRGKEYLIEYNKSEKGRLKSKEISNRLYRCNICGVEIKSPIGLYNHIKKEHNNHKVINVKKLDIKEDVYCLKVNNDFHNFALASGVFVHNCGMIAVQTDYKFEDITPELIDRIMKETCWIIPHGKGIGHKSPQSWDGYEEVPKFPTYIQSALNESRYQLGTLGSGNHFVEMLKGEDGFIWLMIHSGSRNLGYQICNEFHHQATHLMNLYHIQLPDPNLAYLPIETKEGKAYYDLMNFALKFAFENRKRMMNIFQSITCGMLACSVQQEIDVFHNYAAFERHYGKDVIVHRKGAVTARKDQLSVIPGSMGTTSYIVRGLGNKESFESSSHGAGRVLGRREANKTLNRELVEKSMSGIWINQIQLDESPCVYKDIDKVIEDQSDLIEPVVKLHPIGVIIG